MDKVVLNKVGHGYKPPCEKAPKKTHCHDNLAWSLGQHDPLDPKACKWKGATTHSLHQLRCRRVLHQ